MLGCEVRPFALLLVRGPQGGAQTPVTKEQLRKADERNEKLQEENGDLRITMGEYRGKSEALKKQLLQLMAPKPTEPEAPKQTAADADRKRA
jgi:hypothetical protein